MNRKHNLIRRLLCERIDWLPTSGIAALIIVLGLTAAHLCAAEPGQKDANPKKQPAASAADEDGLDSLLEGTSQGTRFRLVDAADPKRALSEVVYWRTLLGVVAAQTTPAEFRLGGDDIIAPKLPTERPDGEDVPADEIVYPTEGFLKLKDGNHVLQPGNMQITVSGGEPASKHPAVKIIETDGGRHVDILCAPVRLDAVDLSGAPIPVTIDVGSGEKSLLRAKASFNPLVIWLPIGTSYTSTLGSFKLDEQGKLTSVRPSSGVKATERGLRREVRERSVPNEATAAAPSVVQFNMPQPEGEKGPAPTFGLFYTPHVLPGEPLWLAISRRQYERVAGLKFDPSQFGLSQEDRGYALALESDQTPPEAIVARASSDLRDSSDQLVWLKTFLPPRSEGPVSLLLNSQAAGRAWLHILSAELGQGLHLVPYRWRTSFAESEEAVYELLIPAGAAGEAKVFAQCETTGKEEPTPKLTLGTVKLPAVEQGKVDSRLFTLQMRDLNPGRYRLWVEAGERKSGRVPVEVIVWSQKSPFFVHSMSGCTASWPTTDAGLQVLQDAGLEMATATGATSQLSTQMPKIDREFAQRLAGAGLDLPVEIATPVTPNDMLLSRMLSHQLRLIDLTVVRQYGMYNEGLSYHHSYQPSVDRTLRRMQLFTQQTADYPSFFGVNYSWFPALFGYVEGGVPTDAHAGERNRVLAEHVEAAGYVGLSADERKWLNEHRNDAAPEAREKVLQLQERAVNHWKKQNELGWGQHNQLYNNAIREVKPDAVCTLFENAGHNEGKSTREMFRDMNAVCYESYTDFGDWPMSSGFVVDWSKGNAPGQPVWLTTCWGASSEGKMKSLLHAFARGMEGGGVPLQASFELPELTRRGTGMKFLGQYGALTTHAVPDRRLAILSRASKQVLTPRGMWQYHAVYSYLTRLGFPAVLIADDEVATQGIPDSVQVLALVQEQNPFEKATLAAIEKFQARGGKVLSIGEKVVPVPGALTLDQPVKQIWDFSGFHPDVHAEMWAEFQQHWQAPLEKLLGQTGLKPLATTDSNRGYVLTMDAGPVRYVAVIADAAGKHSNEFVRTTGLEVSVEGNGWLARDLVKQVDLTTKAATGRTLVSVDLMTEPTTLLALYRAAPATVETLANSTAQGQVQAGSTLRLQGIVHDARQQAMVGVPVSLRLVDSQGNERGQWYRGANDVLEVPVPQHAPAGQWQLTMQELLTGVTSVAKFAVTPPAKPTPTAVEVAAVHRVNEDHLQAFAHRAEEKLIIVESNQQELLPVAEKLAAAITSAGIPARVWAVQPEEFDTIPQRWFPRPEDSARYEQVAAGKLIGYRKNLEAYIDRIKRTHVPELGGYGDIEPNYLVGKDCIVFSGGKLAESLRAVTAWMDTPHVPGRGQGRLVVCFSPFAAGKQVTAVVSNDLEGARVAAESLAETFTSAQPKQKTPADVAKVQPPDTELLKLTTGDKATKVPQPYLGYTPIQRVQRFLTTRAGQAALLLEGDADNLAFVDPAGMLLHTAKLSEVDPKLARLDHAGRLVLLHKKTMEKHPGWGFATSIEYTADRIDQQGQRVESQVAYRGKTSALPPDYESAFEYARGADSVIYPRFGGFMFRSPAMKWQFFDDLPFVRRRYEVLFPRMPISVHFSPEGSYALVSFETRPPFGAFSQPWLNPVSAETILLDLKTGERVWALRGEDDIASVYAVHAGFGAVAADGKMTAMTDYNGVVYLVDKSGKIVLRHQAVAPDRQAQHIGPPTGIGTAISDDGETALFAFQSQVVWGTAKGESHVEPLPGVSAAALASDGSLALVARSGGELVAMLPDGKTQWTKSFGPTRLDLAAIEQREFLVATGTGELVKLSPAGEAVWQVNVAKAADAGQHPVTDAADLLISELPDAYREPNTLAVAQKQLQAKQIAAWKPSGESQEIAGKKFYTVSEDIQLAGDKAAKEYFLHLVYRRPSENKMLSVSTKGPDGSEMFELDLPTPSYRVADIPVRGPAASVTISSEGPVEIAECTLYSLKFPGQNLAYVAPAGSGLEKKTQPKEEDPLGDDLLSELTGESEDQGAIKTCRIWWPNSDPDAILGPFLRAPLDPTQMVDGKRFGAGKINPWSNKHGNNSPTRGAFFTVDFDKPKSFSLVATYERVTKQSEVSRNVAVFSTDDREHDFLISGKLLAGAEENDQFWRLIPLPAGEAPILGVHVFRDETNPAGLSEIEVYK